MPDPKIMAMKVLVKLGCTLGGLALSFLGGQISSSLQKDQIAKMVAEEVARQLNRK